MKFNFETALWGNVSQQLGGIGERQKSSAKYYFTKSPESGIIGAETLNESR